LPAGVYIKLSKNVTLTSTMEGKVAVVMIAIALVFMMLGNPFVQDNCRRLRSGLSNWNDRLFFRLSIFADS